MSRSWHHLLVVLIGVLGLACAPLKGTKHICVDSSFIDSQQGLIRKAFGTWNKLGQEYVGYDLLADDGDCELPEFKIDDLNDDTHAIYNAVRGEAFQRIRKNDSKSSLAFTTTADSVIFTFVAYRYIVGGCVDSTIKCTNPDYDTAYFEAIVTHELGHYLGLTHVENDPVAVMNSRASWFYNSTVFTVEDLRSFCKWYDCTEKDPP